MNAKNILVAGLMLVGAVLIVRRSEMGNLPQQGRVYSQSYPGPGTPTITPSATSVASATPTKDAQGYLPAPAGLLYNTETITTSDLAALLVPLQNELTNQEAISLSLRTLNPETPLAYIKGDSESGYSLSDTEVQDVLSAYFTANAEPLIQAYFYSEDTSYPCAVVITYQYPAPFSHGLPTPEPPDPTDTPMMGLPFPASIVNDAAAWSMCRSEDGAWWWDKWEYGDYYDSIHHLYDNLVIPNGWSLTIIEP